MSVLRCNNGRIVRSAIQWVMNKKQKRTAEIHSSSEYWKEKFLHQSTLPTYHYQNSIPKLPIPQLDLTCTRYIRAITPLFRQDQLDKTREIVTEFCNGEGKQLQKELQEYARKNPGKSYMSDPWFDMYINAREALPLNFSAALQFTDDPRPGYMDPAIRTTNIIASTLRFMNSLEAENLRPYVVPVKPNKANAAMVKNVPMHNKGEEEKFIRAIPVCMDQFKHIFKSTRIPKLKRDVLKRSPTSRHMSAMRKGHFYTFDVIDSKGDPLPASTILSSVQKILDDPRPPNPHPLGILTAQNRDLWARLREEVENAGNAEALDEIDAGIFMFIFDDDVMEDSAELTRSFLHGTGTNRWFDKSFQMVMNKKGKLAMILEHSWGDGMTGLYYGQELFKDIHSGPAVGPITMAQGGTVKKIELNLPESVKEAIDTAVSDYRALTSTLEVQHVSSTRFSKEAAKAAKVSPDAIAQLGFQLAFYRTHGYICPTYESCSTAIFRYGRTETLRPATIETTNFCHLADTPADPKPPREELRKALREAAAMHSKLSGEAAMGQGFDRHLFGLRHVVQRRGGQMPAIFTDPSYAASCYFRLSTSTLGSVDFLQSGSFGPVVPDGYGITYVVGEKEASAVITSYQDNELDNFCKAVEDSWNEICELLQD